LLEDIPAGGGGAGVTPASEFWSGWNSDMALLTLYSGRLLDRPQSNVFAVPAPLGFEAGTGNGPFKILAELNPAEVDEFCRRAIESWGFEYQPPS
jgi:hypothetical protein